MNRSPDHMTAGIPVRHTIIFFDQNSSKIDDYKKILATIKYNINLVFIHSDFDELMKSISLDAIVSPANSRLCMDGGIDLDYANYFPGIEDKLRQVCIKKKYATSEFIYKGTNFIVPIGKCIATTTDNPNCKYVLAAPTMITPKDIRGTNNVYLAMRAIIRKINCFENSAIIACPCLGTGIGAMSGIESAQQIRQALLKD
ncbi:macro domain-containing protein [Cotonvirus japonicus]|uniref:Macro domain-containing protein n=1 Tax=Cotonvirus japonicus TaxID=2811091 RepID=A0ABM7NRS9_9VIRU|nr:macro domain-containing protein [Cotonvirus japonicus]BCS82797.1 macro domain-containing protein [Cotonvirus japonicus]